MTTANEESGSYSSLTAEVTPQSVLTLLCPWTKEIPTRLRQRLHWNPTPLPEGEIHDPTTLILYAGDDDPTSLHQAMLQESQHWPVQILEIDNKRPGKAVEHDMLGEEPYGRLCRAAIQGKLRALLGGPNCRTWSIRRWFPKPGAPQPVRGRHPDLTWGLPGIRQEEQQDTDNDSILLLRFMVIMVLAHEGAKQQDLSRPATMLEHPEALRTQFSAHHPHQRQHVPGFGPSVGCATSYRHLG